MSLNLDDRLRNFRAQREAPAAASPPLLANLFDGKEIVHTDGTYYLIDRLYDGAIDLPPGRPERIKRNLRLLYGIGPRTEEKLYAMGLDSLDKLAQHERWSTQAEEVLRAIAACDLRYLQQRGVHDRDLLAFFLPEDIVFVDIETTGLYSVLPLFLVGMLFSAGGRLHLVQFLARRFEEERALLAAVAAELSRFKLIVSYNGRAFDVPYLCGRFLAHRVPCQLNQVHIDLLRHARRKYRSTLPDCRLVTIEEAVLAMSRTDDVPGALIPELYHQYVKTQDPALISGIVEHNALDLLALVRLLHLVE